MSKDYPNKRDCEHGSLRGSCETCDYEQEITELKSKITELEKSTAWGVHHFTSDELAKRDLESQPKWISVDDESPALGEDVLVFPIKMHLSDEPVYTAHRTKSWGFEYIWCNTIYAVKGVTHWMPLPEKPKGGEL